MPFISKDWRDPGKLWIKTDRGWEEKMVIEKMEMMSDDNLRYDDLLTAMQNALDAAAQREALARQVLHSDVGGSGTSAAIHQLRDSEVDRRALFDDTLFELSRARQQRRCIEWEISKRRCLRRDRDWDLSNESAEETETSQRQEMLDKDDGSPERREASPTRGVSQPSYFLLKINVRERVEYIEKNNTLLYISPCDDNDLKGDDNENVYCGESSSQSTDCKDKDDGHACASMGTKRTLGQQHKPDYLSVTGEQRNSDDVGKEIQAIETYGTEHAKPTVTQNLSRHESFVFPAPPHCHITLKNTREISGFNRLCEALKRLDFRGAAWDTQRFNYICKLIELLTAKKLRSLTGGSQKMLLVLLEEVARSVRSSQQNIHVLRRLVAQVQERLFHCLLWGKQLGSTPLWRENTNRLNLIKAIATTITVQTPGSPFHPTLQDLPEECVREILLRLTTHTDLQCAGESYSVMGNIIEEQRIWRQLCRFHWSEQQMSFVQQQFPHLLRVPTDWRMLYTRLKRSFGLREEFAVSLVLCRACQCLFWASLGHPCLAEQDPDLRNKIKGNSNSHSDMFVTIPPHTFLTFFS